ncbi:MAG: HAD family hydrolase [Phycisphaerae bacterium]|nr:HAD family hydrolase [Phycisphaerae bacterium]
MPFDASLPRSRQVVIFDMDGTLTVSSLDFDRIRAEIGLPAGPILESLDGLAPSERMRAEAILHRHEIQDAENSQLQLHAAETVHSIRSAGHPVALMTRNSRQSLELFQRRHHIEFDLTWTREDGPMKPSPEPVFEICRRLSVDPRAGYVVGDFRFDVICGNSAGCTSVLYLEPGFETPDWASEATLIIRRLSELTEYLAIRPR